MAISKLHLFYKNTDANDSIRGYQFQILRTLDVWIENYINKVEDEIYCEYEDDIFQKNAISGTAKFHQVKLYSSNFSFKSEEITKCIAHFFLLYNKTDHDSFEKVFVFETNADIARKHLDNDAELLREWVDNQTSLGEDLLSRCAVKVKSVVSAYVSQESDKLQTKIDPEILKEAIQVFEALGEDDWNNFTQAIRWEFTKTESDLEFSSTKTRIEANILKLPFSINRESLQQAFGVLYTVVALRAANDLPQNRKLTLKDFEQLMLNLGSEEDKWYSTVQAKWSDSNALDRFNVGEFLEVIDAVKYCRRRSHFTSHDSHWFTLLELYIHMSVQERYRRTAIYEFCWLKFRANKLSEPPSGTLRGSEPLLVYYFENVKDIEILEQFEDALSLLHIVTSAQNMGLCDVTQSELKQWYITVYRELGKKLDDASDPNEQCYLLEIKANYWLFIYQFKKNRRNYKHVLTCYEQILLRIDKAIYYDVTRLSSRINTLIKLFIKIRTKEYEQLIKSMESISEKLDVYVQARDGEHKSAKIQAERAFEYINSSDRELLLKALNYFHRAKELWNHQETIEGHVLALLNIGQLYHAVDMNYAAKYYGICALWISINNGEQQLLKRIADSFSIIFAADFQQGAWYSATIDFNNYVSARSKFTSEPINDDDQSWVKMTMFYAYILYSTPLLEPLLQEEVTEWTSRWPDVSSEYLTLFAEQYSHILTSPQQFKATLENKLVDTPLNDIGPRRKISFYAQGSLWQISFNNDYTTTSVAEEFCSMLQILLVEIALTKIDFHLIKSNVLLELEISANILPPEPLVVSSGVSWKVHVTKFDDPTEFDKHIGSKHAALISIINELSLLKQEEFHAQLESFYSEMKLQSKMLGANAYQRIYRYVFDEESFKSEKRTKYNPVKLDLNLPSANQVMKWNDSLSAKYDQAKALLDIKNRYKRSLPPIHLTLTKLKKDVMFRDFVKKLRAEGWKDWQVLLGLMNFIVSTKVNARLRNKEFDSATHFLEMQKEYSVLIKLNEEDNYVEFTFQDLNSNNFRRSLDLYAPAVLEVWGLENKMRTPNIPALKEFLNVRFNMSKDDVLEENPLGDIS